MHTSLKRTQVHALLPSLNTKNHLLAREMKDLWIQAKSHYVKYWGSLKLSLEKLKSKLCSNLVKLNIWLTPNESWWFGLNCVKLEYLAWTKWILNILLVPSQTLWTSSHVVFKNLTFPNAVKTKYITCADLMFSAMAAEVLELNF
jgi:hypothetical protein